MAVTERRSPTYLNFLDYGGRSAPKAGQQREERDTGLEHDISCFVTQSNSKIGAKIPSRIWALAGVRTWPDSGLLESDIGEAISTWGGTKELLRRKFHLVFSGNCSAVVHNIEISSDYDLLKEKIRGVRRGSKNRSHWRSAWLLNFSRTTGSITRERRRSG